MSRACKAESTEVRGRLSLLRVGAGGGALSGLRVLGLEAGAKGRQLRRRAGEWSGFVPSVPGELYDSRAVGYCNGNLWRGVLCSRSALDFNCKETCPFGLWPFGRSAVEPTSLGAEANCSFLCELRKGVSRTQEAVQNGNLGGYG